MKKSLHTRPRDAYLETVFDERLGIEKTMKQHLPRCHRHLQTREKNGGAGVRRARTRRSRHFVPPLASPSPSRRELLAVGSSLRLRALLPSTRPGSGWNPWLESPKKHPHPTETRCYWDAEGTAGKRRRTLPAQGRRTDLRQPEENAGGLDELAAQDAQIGLAGQVEPVLH